MDLPIPTLPGADQGVSAGERSDYPFVVGASYTRADVFRVIGLVPAPVGGPWFTGYTAHGRDWFIFCGVGAPGRTGHDYDNHFDGDRLVWFGKGGTTLRQPSIQKLVHSDGQVYVFFRAADRQPFTFAGVGEASEVADQTPVRVVWAFQAPGGARLPSRPPEEIDPEDVSTVFEGARRTVQVNVYERDLSARRACLAVWGTRCVVCSFDFQERYGELGEGFIHVHHLKPLGEIRDGYQLDPIADLRPVCPNCHAMLHRRKPVLTIQQLIALLG